MNEEKNKEFTDLCEACEVESVYRAAVVFQLREAVDLLKAIAINSKEIAYSLVSIKEDVDFIRENMDR